MPHTFTKPHKYRKGEVRSPPAHRHMAAGGRGVRRTCLHCLPRVLTRVIVSHLNILSEKTRTTDAVAL